LDCRVQEPHPFFKGQGHAYILKVHAITIRDYRYNNTKINIKQWVAFILFSFHNTCMLKKSFPGAFVTWVTALVLANLRTCEL
jgi:hypothetical protein